MFKIDESNYVILAMTFNMDENNKAAQFLTDLLDSFYDKVYSDQFFNLLCFQFFVNINTRDRRHKNVVVLDSIGMFAKSVKLLKEDSESNTILKQLDNLVDLKEKDLHILYDIMYYTCLLCCLDKTILKILINIKP